MLTFAKLEHLLTQIANHASDHDEPTFVFADDEHEELIVWPLADVMLSIRLQEGGAVLEIAADLDEVPEEQRADVLTWLLELNYLWRSLPMSLGLSGGRVQLVAWRPTDELTPADLESVLRDTQRLAEVVASAAARAAWEKRDTQDDAAAVFDAEGAIRV